MLSREEFYNSPEGQESKRSVKSCANWCYLLALFNLLVMFVLIFAPGSLKFWDPDTSPLFMLVDISIISVLGYYIGRASMFAAVAFLMYGVLNYVIAHTGWLFIILGIFSLVRINNFNKRYKQYSETDKID